MKLARDAASILVLATLIVSVRVHPPGPIDDLMPDAEAAFETLALPAAAIPEVAVPIGSTWQELRPALRVLRLDRGAAPAAAPEPCTRLQVKRVKHGAIPTVTIEVDRRARRADAECDREAICLPFLPRNDC